MCLPADDRERQRQAARQRADLLAVNEYAWALVSYQPEDVREPAVALAFAMQAVERAGSPNPVYLHTLGWAHYLSGSTEAAVRTLREALALVPPSQTGPAVGLRRQIENDLKIFAAGQPRR